MAYYKKPDNNTRHSAELAGLEDRLAEMERQYAGQPNEIRKQVLRPLKHRIERLKESM
jgi:hypothetical protein